LTTVVLNAKMNLQVRETCRKGSKERVLGVERIQKRQEEKMRKTTRHWVILRTISIEARKKTAKLLRKKHRGAERNISTGRT